MKCFTKLRSRLCFLVFRKQWWYPVQSSLRLYSDASLNGTKLCNLHRKVMTDRISGGWILAVGWLMGWKAWPLLSPTAEGLSLVTHTRNQYFHKGLLALPSTGTHSDPMAKIITRCFFPLIPLLFFCFPPFSMQSACVCESSWVQQNTCRSNLSINCTALLQKANSPVCFGYGFQNLLSYKFLLFHNSIL